MYLNISTSKVIVVGKYTKYLTTEVRFTERNVLIETFNEEMKPVVAKKVFENQQDEYQYGVFQNLNLSSFRSKRRETISKN